MNMTVKMSALASASTAALHDASDDASRCPVATIAREHNELVAIYNALDADFTSETKLQRQRDERVIIDRMEVIREGASFMKPISKLGAAFQVMIASADVDLCDGCKDGPHRDAVLRRVERLLFCAAGYLLDGNGDLSHSYEYMMGSHVDPHARLNKLRADHAG
jgi:hypothetical protein